MFLFVHDDTSVLLVSGERCNGGVVGVLEVEIFVLGIEKVAKLKQVVEQGYLRIRL